MFDYSKATYKAWVPGIPEGDYDFISSRYQLGELSVTLYIREDPSKKYACELTCRPLWHCWVDDEQHQISVMGWAGKHGGGDFFEVENSPVIESLSKFEPLFDKHFIGRARHWVVLTMQECLHFVADAEPKFRTVEGFEP